MAEDAELKRIFEDKAKSGVRMRILLGDPDSPVVAGRGHDEGIDEAIAGKVRNESFERVRESAASYGGA